MPYELDTLLCLFVALWRDSVVLVTSVVLVSLYSKLTRLYIYTYIYILSNFGLL